MHRIVLYSLNLSILQEWGMIFSCRIGKFKFNPDILRIFGRSQTWHHWGLLLGQDGPSDWRQFRIFLEEMGGERDETAMEIQVYCYALPWNYILYTPCEWRQIGHLASLHRLWWALSVCFIWFRTVSCHKQIRLNDLSWVRFSLLSIFVSVL